MFEKLDGTVALVARRADRLEKLAQQIRAAGGTALPIEADISSAQEAARVVASTVAAFGRLDTLVNAAGVMPNGPPSNPRWRIGIRWWTSICAA
ncbi:SDR family NAD(P)-dependent oxidoreductase [Verticiella sediminum]|uniref:SDR family NAD(P)-dependent oxidoreductase n=1 Tax=Verticiella sediminum TaxID=1247510 RepID=UPI001B8824D1|nr:SDR family NAD(P)-dependent oxidoreductase [Verticiella sediminum]